MSKKEELNKIDECFSMLPQIESKLFLAKRNYEKIDAVSENLDDDAVTVRKENIKTTDHTIFEAEFDSFNVVRKLDSLFLSKTGFDLECYRTHARKFIPEFNRIRREIVKLRRDFCDKSGMKYKQRSINILKRPELIMQVGFGAALISAIVLIPCSWNYLTIRDELFYFLMGSGGMGFLCGVGSAILWYKRFTMDIERDEDGEDE